MLVETRYQPARHEMDDEKGIKPVLYKIRMTARDTSRGITQHWIMKGFSQLLSRPLCRIFSTFLFVYLVPNSFSI